MGVTNIEVMTYGVDDLETSCRFWRDFGLAPSEDLRTWSAADGSAIMLRSSGDPTLPPSSEGGSTLREVTFGVDTAESLEAIAAELSRDRDVSADDTGTIHTIDPLGFAIAFRQTRRRPVVAPELKFNTPGRPDRLNTRGEFFKRARPLELTHTVYMVEEPSEIVPFYTERLGFLVSDSYPGRGYFMRGGASSHHHDLFMIRIPGKRGFHHAAFELGSIHELFGGGLHMTRQGWETALGPGRHPISSCYFWYFKCPSGGAAEYDFDSDLVDSNWIPGEFEQTPENFAEWCLAEGMQETLLYRGIQGSRTAGK
jgi:catechol 2,3-dioxygenase-like lactoylglutathione lyase family enzyme